MTSETILELFREQYKATAKAIAWRGPAVIMEVFPIQLSG